jgi:rare lipoprotein A
MEAASRAALARTRIHNGRRKNRGFLGKGAVIPGLLLGAGLFLQGWADEPKPTDGGSSGGGGSTERAPVADGIASYYGKGHHGKKTANGEIFDMYKLTAAHRSLPFGSRVKVTNLSNNRSVVVRINDRGPFIAGRIIDLSQAAAEQLEMIRPGIVPVKVEVVESPAKREFSSR